MSHRNKKKGMPVTRETVEKEISRCILISAEEKPRWIAVARQAPGIMLASMYKVLKTRNDLNDRCILETFRRKPELLETLKRKITKIKRTASELQEEDARPGELEGLEQKMRNL